MPSAPHWKLRRLAPRAKRILARRSAESPALAAYGATLPSVTDAFIQAYDGVANYQTTWRKEMQEGKSAIGALVTLIRGWLPLLTRDVPGFDPSSFGDHPDVPDDVIEDGERLLSAIKDGKDKKGNELSYGPTALAALEASITAADKEWSEAEASDAEYQSRLAATRATADAFDKELQAFRRSLGTVLGRSNKDFQKLRTERASHTDEEDDASGPAAPEPVAPASPEAGPPKGEGETPA
jgi:hypothetical protein